MRLAPLFYIKFTSNGHEENATGYLGNVVMGIDTTTSALLYKHAFMLTWLEWWTVVAS